MKIGIDEIQKVLPHRYPFLLVDRIIEIDDNKSVTGIKNVSFNEPFFQGHFPDNPIMPGVLIIEAMAQVGAYAALNYPEVENKIAFLAGIDRARFRHPVIPGDTLKIKTELVKIRANSGRIKCSAYVEDKLVADAEMTFALIDRGNNE